MLRVWFGERPNAVYNTSVYFKNKYEDEWITEDFARKVIMDVDHSEVKDANTIQSPVLGSISPLQLSGGVKALLLMRHYPGKIFNASSCGDNCAKWILVLGESRNFTINLFHIMDFGKGEFEIRILNHRTLVAHNMQEFLDAGIKYLQETS
ncbi:MAG: DUF4869 domain-containing protein [Atopobiaceae bacterium]|nr:DUF4869 domain-containing protein [Atopobiaceae bacterium]